MGWTTAPVQVGKGCLKKDCADPGGREGSEMSEGLLRCSGANDLSKKGRREVQMGGDMYMLMADSRCCVAESNTTL